MNQAAILRSGLREVVRELEASRSRLLELRRAVPPSPPGGPEEDVEAEPNPLAEMAAVIECGLHDCLEPLIRDLTAAAEYREAAHLPAPAEGTPVRKDGPPAPPASPPAERVPSPAEQELPPDRRELPPVQREDLPVLEEDLPAPKEAPPVSKD